MFSVQFHDTYFKLSTCNVPVAGDVFYNTVTLLKSSKISSSGAPLKPSACFPHFWTKISAMVLRNQKENISENALSNSNFNYKCMIAYLQSVSLGFQAARVVGQFENSGKVSNSGKNLTALTPSLPTGTAPHCNTISFQSLESPSDFSISIKRKD